MKLLSIIVPIYNVENYVEKCLRSLEVQNISRDDYEIICINDGSPDNSREIVLRLQREFDNIILIDQENQGVSRTRNNGIEIATGRYLLFIDPDDFVQVNSLNQILKTSDIVGAQVAITGYTFLDPDGNVQGTRTYDKNEEMVYTGLQAFYLSHKDGQIQADSSVGILFETKFLNNNYLRYLPDVPFLEDGEFLARVHCLANRCIFVKSPFYFVAVRPGSATNSKLFISEEARNGFQLAASNLKRFQHVQSFNEKQKLFLNGPIVQFVLLTIYSALKTKSFKQFVSTVNNLKVLGLDMLQLEGCSGYYFLCGKSYNFSPYLGGIALVLYLKINSLLQSSLFIKKVPIYS